MMLHDFLNDIDSFKDEKVDIVYAKVLAELALIDDVESRRFILEQLTEGLINLEQDDFFGTEGMKI